MTGIFSGVASVIVGLISIELRKISPLGTNIVGSLAYADVLMMVALAVAAKMIPDGRMKTVASVTLGVFIVFEIYENLVVV